MNRKEQSNIETVTNNISNDIFEIGNGLLNDIANIIDKLPDDVLNEIPEGLKNNPYTLIFHLLGSAGYWIGEVVGNIPTDRVRAQEFERTGSREELRELLNDIRGRMKTTLANLRSEQLEVRSFDLSKGVLCWGTPENRTAIWVLVHDLCHIAYHLGQLQLIKMKNAAEQG